MDIVLSVTSRSAYLQIQIRLVTPLQTLGTAHV
jgi:hypothetical protein